MKSPVKPLVVSEIFSFNPDQNNCAICRWDIDLVEFCIPNINTAMVVCYKRLTDFFPKISLQMNYRWVIYKQKAPKSKSFLMHNRLQNKIYNIPLFFLDGQQVNLYKSIESFFIKLFERNNVNMVYIRLEKTGD